MAENPNSNSNPKPGSRAKLVAFSLMLAVPAVLSGCSSNSDECDPEYDTGCEYDSSSGHYYYGGGSSYRSNKDSGSYSKSSSKSSGFGSFFHSSGG